MIQYTKNVAAHEFEIGWLMIRITHLPGEYWKFKPWRRFSIHFEGFYWIPIIWNHYKKSKKNDQMLKTKFSDCLRATIAILFHNWYYGDSMLCNRYSGWEAIAWKDQGNYHTDYGLGKAWSTLSVQNFTVVEFSDGSL